MFSANSINGVSTSSTSDRTQCREEGEEALQINAEENLFFFFFFFADETMGGCTLYTLWCPDWSMGYSGGETEFCSFVSLKILCRNLKQKISISELLLVELMRKLES